MKTLLLWLVSMTLSMATLTVIGQGGSGTFRSINNADFNATLTDIVVQRLVGTPTSSPVTTSGRTFITYTGATTYFDQQLNPNSTGTLSIGPQNWTYSSSATGVATVNSLGYVTQVNSSSTPASTVITVSHVNPTFTFTLPLSLATSASSTTTFTAWTSGLLPYDMNSEVDSRISTAGTATSGTLTGTSSSTLYYNTYIGGKMGLFSAANDSTSTYTRNASLWTGSLDWSGVSVMQSYGTVGNGSSYPGSQFARTLTLITPNDAVSANHCNGWITVGSKYTFVNNSNVVYTATISSQARIGSTDIEIDHLTWNTTPSGLAVYTILPSFTGTADSGYQSYCPDYNLNYFPAVFINQYRQVFVQDSNITGFSGGSFNHSPATETTRMPYSLSVITGDSSNPVFAIINGHMVFLGTTFSAVGAPSLADNVTAINTAISGFSGDSYSLSIEPMTGFGATTNNGSVTSFPTY